MKQRDFLIVGGGVVGMAVAYGLARAGQGVTVLDESDDALRASRGNAGLVWVQGKGVGMPRYAELSLESAKAWADFAGELTERTGIELEYEQRGGVDLCLDAEEARSRQADYAELQNASRYMAANFRWEYLDREALTSCLPGLGETIPGGTWSPHDGQCNPLYLLRALYAASRALGVETRPATPVERLEATAGGFRATTPQGQFTAERVILAAGLGARQLASGLGLTAAVRPVRGQVLVTERRPPGGRLPTPQIRQTASGGYLIGDTHEDAGLDKGVTLAMMQSLAEKAVRIYPDLEAARLVRSWGALRVMTPDGHPLYETSTTHPGAYNLNCHSGITLAAFHAEGLAEAIRDDRLEQSFPHFSGARLHVSAS
ncbi:Glycine/D-amino acid oxidase [Modicisalibacter ilicicola DSM 19980]|uniref:Glycine/D-amino acid oxidase n=1 Tax=Modicisalibacter ilicicola DSM 19980 TaxID=1121942 RepID=A0A1M5DU94_9GAMM|nr:FAD-dependent oxidoreductase [Halomonas ilicicola]SHF70608.1 Glycine/D-amino acid oxidase [Halomonas ilicicola DSM 19980]